MTSDIIEEIVQDLQKYTISLLKGIKPVQFEIRINPNIKLGSLDSGDTSISEAIESIFVNLEYFTMKWHDNLFEVNYKLDIADSIHAIILMLDSIKKKEGYHKIIFPSDHFFEAWECRLDGEVIHIKWLDEDALTDISIESQLFIDEWIKLLVQLRNCILKSGYNNSMLVDFHLLENLERFCG